MAARRLEKHRVVAARPGYDRSRPGDEELESSLQQTEDKQQGVVQEAEGQTHPPAEWRPSQPARRRRMPELHVHRVLVEDADAQEDDPDLDRADHKETGCALGRHVPVDVDLHRDEVLGRRGSLTTCPGLVAELNLRLMHVRTSGLSIRARALHVLKDTPLLDHVAVAWPPTSATDDVRAERRERQNFEQIRPSL